MATMKRVEFFLLLVTTGVCSVPWFRIDSTCFQADETLVDQNAAIKLCQEKGATLHSIQNETEFVNLLHFLPTYPQFWVWARKMSSGFKWGDGRDCCPESWWRPGEPNAGENCARLTKNSNLLLRGHQCSIKYGSLCSKPAVGKWTLVKSTDYNWPDLCGVQILPSCDGLSCEEACNSYAECNQFAKIANLCINIKNDTHANSCIVKMRPNMELYEWTFC